MHRFCSREVLYFFGYIAASIILAAIITPMLYSLGNSFIESSLREESGPIVKWLGGKCEGAPFSRFFKRGLLLSVILLFPVLQHAFRESKEGISKSLFSSKWRFRDILAGLLLGLGSMGSALMIGQFFGWLEPNSEFDWLTVLPKALSSSMFVAVLEEWLFRGLILGVLLRCLPQIWAVMWGALIFTIGHFCVPPAGAFVGDPESMGAGFKMLGLVLREWVSFMKVGPQWCSLLMIGVILSYSRLSSGSLWLPIGMHMGWVLAIKLGQKAFENSGTNSLYRPWVMGEELWSGLVPWACLCVGAFVLKFYLEWRASCLKTRGET